MSETPTTGFRFHMKEFTYLPIYATSDPIRGELVIYRISITMFDSPYLNDLNACEQYESHFCLNKYFEGLITVGICEFLSIHSLIEL